MKQIPDITDSIQIEDEKRKAFLWLEDAWTPYHLVFCGPEDEVWQ